ncbi:MAG: YegS/Rv2252/BmrU family lipid kinase [Lachnospiraceae bacterium]|nr:YegS/Rv2252/BmrU family lipid kinase [Lachnospiraceae bacterium]
MFNFLVNLNSASGRCKHVWRDIESALKLQQIDYRCFCTEYENHASEITESIEKEYAGEPINLVVIGGDGTFNEVINAIKDFDHFRMGLIPAGSGNDLARGMGISNDHMENLNTILCGETVHKCDVGEIVFSDSTSRKFAISCGMGLDAEVCYFALKSRIKDFLNRFHIGESTYLVLTVLRLFSMRTVNAIVRYGNKEEKYGKLIFMAAMNQQCEGGGVKMAPNAKYDDGKLDFISAHNISKFRGLISLGILSKGKGKWIKGISVVPSKETEIILAKKMIFHTDGEFAGKHDRAVIKCVEKQLTFLN